MAQQTFSGVPGDFTAGQVLTAADMDKLREFLLYLIKDGDETDTGEVSPLIMDLNADRIGFGTDAPAQLLHAKGTGGVFMQYESTDSAQVYVAYGNSTTGIGIANGLLVGVDTDETAVVWNQEATSLRLGAGGALALEITSGQKLRSTSTYNNTTGAAANLHISATGEMYRSTSSLRYKTDVEDMDEAWADKVLELRPVWFRSTCTDDNPAWSHWGLIAEEVAEIDPRLVQYGDVYETDEDGALVYDVESVLGDDGEPTTRKAPRVEAADQPVGVAYDRIVPALLSVIQRLEARVAALEA